MSKHIHFLGIGGSGASAVAAIAQAQGYNITGCDSSSPFTEFTTSFDKNVLMQGHSENHLKGVDILAVTPAVFSQDPNNQELIKAKELGIEILTWQEFMGKYLEKDKFVIAVCGTHGKSTTTAMISLLLEDAGLDPTVELGAIVPEWNSNYRIGKSKYFVTEADEFNNNFFASIPDISVVTSIEMDHPEFFQEFEDYQNSFKTFLSKTKQEIVANISDSGVANVLKDLMKQSGVSCLDYSKNSLNFDLQVPGNYNRLNAQAAFQAGLLLGINPETIQESLSNFRGIGRRQEVIGKFKGATVISDFAHHPTEIKVTYEALKDHYKGKKIWIIFQPHMFSRTKALFEDFVKVFRKMKGSQIVISDIYPSREIDTGLVSSKQLVEVIKQKNVQYISDFQGVTKFLEENVKRGEIIIFFGAGDIDALARKLIKKHG